MNRGDSQAFTLLFYYTLYLTVTKQLVRQISLYRRVQVMKEGGMAELKY